MKKYTIFTVLLFALLFLGAGCLSGGGSDLAGGDGGVIKSTDKGEAWEQKVFVRSDERGRAVTLGETNVQELRFYPGDSRLIYLGTREHGLWRTEDGGEKWSQLGFPQQSVKRFDVDPKNKNRLAVALNNQIVLTEDATDGAKWRAVYTDSRQVSVTDIKFHLTDSRVLYAGLSSGEIMRSNDGGYSWSAIHRFEGDEYVAELVPDKLASNVIYAPTVAHGLYKTVDGGKTWNAINDGFKQFSRSFRYRGLVQDVTRKNAFFHLSEYGILKTLDGGETWQAIPLLTPPLGAKIYGFDVNPKNSREIYYTTENTLYKTNDSGQTWSTNKTPGSRIGNVLLVDFFDPTKIYMGLLTPIKQKASIF